MKCKVDTEDLFILLGSSIRYAMRRRSYIVSTIIEQYLKYYNKLTIEEQSNIITDINKELLRAKQEDRYLGDLIDHEQWEKLVSKFPNLIKIS